MGDVTHYVGDHCPGGHYEETTVSDPTTDDDLNRPISGMGMLDLVDEVKNLRAEVRRLQDMYADLVEAAQDIVACGADPVIVARLDACLARIDARDRIGDET